MDPTCVTCRYWYYAANEPTDTGECRRHPPRQPTPELVEEGHGPCHGVWPETFASEWCGEWQPVRLGAPPRGNGEG